jgi:peptidyl-prolyl cis-trans isomerase C
MTDRQATVSNKRRRTFSTSQGLVALTVLGCLACSCNRQGSKGPVAAKVGDSTLFVGDVEKRINSLDDFTRYRYQTAAGKQEYVDGLIRLELLAQEAKRRGYDRDPEFILAMHRELASRLLQDDFVKKTNKRIISASEVEEYYKTHQSEFTKPRKVRVLQLVLSKQETAEQAAAEARQLKPEDEAGFRALMKRFSDAGDTQPKGRDTLTIDANTTVLPKAAVDLVLGLKTIGAIAGPIDLGGRFGIFRVLEISEEFVKALSQSETRIRQQISKDAMTREVDALMQTLRERTPVRKFDESIDRMVIKPGLASSPPSNESPRAADNKAKDPDGIQKLLGDKPERSQPIPTAGEH